MGDPFEGDPFEGIPELPAPYPPLEIIELGQVLLNPDDGSRWVRAKIRVFWDDAASKTGIVIELKLPVEITPGASFDALRKEALMRLPGILAEASRIAGAFPS